MPPSGLRAVSGAGGGLVKPQVAIGVVFHDGQAAAGGFCALRAARRASVMLRPVGFWKLGSTYEKRASGRLGRPGRPMSRPSACAGHAHHVGLHGREGHHRAQVGGDSTSTLLSLHRSKSSATRSRPCCEPVVMSTCAGSTFQGTPAAALCALSCGTRPVRAAGRSPRWLRTAGRLQGRLEHLGAGGLKLGHGKGSRRAGRRQS